MVGELFRGVALLFVRDGDVKGTGRARGNAFVCCAIKLFWVISMQPRTEQYIRFPFVFVFIHLFSEHLVVFTFQACLCWSVRDLKGSSYTAPPGARQH